MSTKPSFWMRASSLGSLLDCPARWEAVHLLGMKSKSSAASHLGTSIHASTAVFDSSFVNGDGVTVDEALGAFVDKLHDKDADVEWGDDDITKAKAEEIGSILHKKYCTEVTPKQDYTAVEVECKSLTVEFGDMNIVLTGTTDRVRKTDKGLGIADIKTGKMAVKADGTVDAAKHGAQLAVYELLVEQATGHLVTAPAEIIGLQTSSKARVGTVEVTTAKDVLLGSEGQKGLLEHAAGILRNGLFYGNPRSMMCGEKYCPRFKQCRFRY